MKVCILEKHNDLFRVYEGETLFLRAEVEDIEAEKLGSISYNGEPVYLYVTDCDYKPEGTYLPLEEVKTKVRDVLDYVVFNKYIELFERGDNYKDFLTGLDNQNAYLKYIDELSEYKGENIHIFYIDANGLKVANDTMGYEAGDELLKGCGQIMLKVFEDKGKCFRRGGDEFVAIVTGNDVNPKDYYEKLKKEAWLFKGEFITDMSISVGYSSNVEVGVYDINAIENAADASMHANKEAYYCKKFKNKNYIPESGEGKFYKLIHDTFELMPAGICMVDIEDNYSYYRFNTPFMKFFGYEKADDFYKISFKELLKNSGIELDKFDKNNRSKEYLIKGHKLKINYSDDREYGETLFVALYI